jgi:hypothetical protein
VKAASIRGLISFPALAGEEQAAVAGALDYLVNDSAFRPLRDVTLRYVFRLTSVVFADNRVRFLPHE